MAKLIIGAEGINKAIRSIAVRGAKLDDSIQIAGLSILNHVHEHGDSTLADRLFMAMPKGARRVMLAEWFVAFGKLRTLNPKDADDAARIKAGAHFAYDKTRETDLKGAEAKAWHEMRKAQEASEAFDAAKAAKSLLTRLTKASKDGLSIENKAKAAEELRAALAMLED